MATALSQGSAPLALYVCSAVQGLRGYHSGGCFVLLLAAVVTARALYRLKSRIVPHGAEDVRVASTVKFEPTDPCHHITEACGPNVQPT